MLMLSKMIGILVAGKKEAGRPPTMAAPARGFSAFCFPATDVLSWTAYHKSHNADHKKPSGPVWFLWWVDKFWLCSELSWKPCQLLVPHCAACEILHWLCLPRSNLKAKLHSSKLWESQQCQANQQGFIRIHAHGQSSKLSKLSVWLACILLAFRHAAKPTTSKRSSKRSTRGLDLATISHIFFSTRSEF